MGANQKRFHFLNEQFYLDDDCTLFENTIRHLNVRMVVIDPLTQFLSGRHNMNTAQSVGNLMRELSAVAARTNTVIVVVSHVAKNSYNKEIDRHLGSSDIVNAARSVLSITRVNEDEDIIMVKHLKSTLAKRAAPFYYEIVGNGLIEFMTDVDMVDDELPFVGRKQSKADVAKEMILDLLTNNPMKGDDVVKIVMDSAGMSLSTANTAKRAASVLSEKIGDVWWWYLPGQDAKSAAGLHLEL